MPLGAVHTNRVAAQRLPWVALLCDADLRARLHAYIEAASRELDCPPLQVGGVADHVHILARTLLRRHGLEWGEKYLWD